MYYTLIPIYITIFLFGIVIGSFLNVCIYRIPAGESIVTDRSHCMTCGYQLKWYDLIPILSWLVLRGRCRKCGEKISGQYPLIEAVNGILYVIIFYVMDLELIPATLTCLLASALVVLSVIDFQTYEIPLGINIFILVLGALTVFTDSSDWSSHVIGFFAISIVLELIQWISKGRAIGGGDVKLMAAAGLFLGWKLIILAFFIACIAGAVIHVIRMKVSNVGKVLAMGPYLSLGILISALWGNQVWNWYMSILMGY